MENDKLFDLMSKMYGEMQDTKNEVREGFKKADKQFEKMETELNDVKHTVTKIETKIEHELSDKMRGLYDDREVVNNKLDKVDEKVDALQKSVNDLSIKSLATDNKLIDLSRMVK